MARTVFEIAQSLQNKIENDLQFPYRQKEVIRQSFLADDQMPELMTRTRLNTLNNRFEIQDRVNTWESDLGASRAKSENDRLIQEDNLRTFNDRARLEELKREKERLEVEEGIMTFPEQAELDRLEREKAITDTQLGILDNDIILSNPEAYRELKSLEQQLALLQGRSDIDDFEKKRQAEIIERQMREIRNKVQIEEDKATLENMDEINESKRLQREADNARARQSIADSMTAIESRQAQDEINRIMESVGEDWSTLPPDQQIDILIPHLNNPDKNVRKMLIQTLREGPVADILLDLNAIDEYVINYAGQAIPTSAAEKTKRTAAVRMAAEAIARLNASQILMLIDKGILQNRDTTSPTLMLLNNIASSADPELKAQAWKDLLNGVDISKKYIGLSETPDAAGNSTDVPADIPADGTTPVPSDTTQGTGGSDLPAETSSTEAIPPSTEETTPAQEDVPTDDVNTFLSEKYPFVRPEFIESTIAQYGDLITREAANEEEASEIIDAIKTAYQNLSGSSNDMANSILRDAAIRRINLLRIAFDLQ